MIQYQLGEENQSHLLEKISAPVNNIPPVLNYPKIHYKDHFIKGAPGGSVRINMKEKRDQKNGFRANQETGL